MEFYIDDFQNYEHLGHFYTEGDVEEPEGDQATDGVHCRDGQSSESESDIDVLNLDPVVAEGNDDDVLQEEDVSQEGCIEADNQQNLEWSQGMSNVHIREFSENSGPQHSLPLDATPLDYFSLLWPESLFETITEETNRYAEQRMAAAEKKDPYWVPTTVNEIKAFFALAIMMGIKNLPRLYCYWAGNVALRCDWISGTMSHSRYVKINQYLHVRDNKSLPRFDHCDYDPIFKVRNVVEVVRENFGKYYYPHCEVAVDEGMIPFKGRLFFKQHMPAKPTKWGVKVWELCESETGYCLNFDIYTGRNRKAGPTHGLGHQVVMSLTEPYWHRNHHVYFDRFFSSPRLLEDMLKCSLYGCSTINMNRVGLPDKAKQLKLRNKGDVEFFQKGNLVLTVWRDKRVVVMLTSNAEGKMITLPDGRLKPDAIMKYNKYMGGVDRSDQYRSYYHVGRTSKKWWRYIIWFLMNLSIVNAWLLYRESKHDPPPPKGYDHFQFRIELAEQLRAGFSGRCQTKGRKPKHDRSECYGEAIGAHKLVRIPNRKRVCRECSQNGRKTRSGRQIQTSFRCGICDLPLCRARCFREYHKSITADVPIVVDVGGEDEENEEGDEGEVEGEEDDIEIVSVNRPNVVTAGYMADQEDRREMAPMSGTPTPSKPSFSTQTSSTSRSVEAAGDRGDTGMGTQEPSIVDSQSQASVQPMNPVCCGSTQGDSEVVTCGTSMEDDDLVIIVESSTAPPVIAKYREKRAVVKIKTRKRQRKSKSKSGQTTKKDVSTSTSVDASESIPDKGMAHAFLTPAIFSTHSGLGNTDADGRDSAEATFGANEVIVIDLTDGEEDNALLQEQPPSPPPPPPPPLVPASKRKKKRPKKRRYKKMNSGEHKKTTTEAQTQKRKSVMKEKVVISNQRKGAPRACKVAGVGVYQDKINYYGRSKPRAHKQAAEVAIIDLTGEDDIAPESSVDLTATTLPLGHLGDSDETEVVNEAASNENENNNTPAAAAISRVAMDGGMLLKEETADHSLSKGVERAICQPRENTVSGDDESEGLVPLLRDDAIPLDAANHLYPQQRHVKSAVAVGAGVDSTRQTDETVVSDVNMKEEMAYMNMVTGVFPDNAAAEMERIRMMPHEALNDTNLEKEVNAHLPEEAAVKDVVKDMSSRTFGIEISAPQLSINVTRPDTCTPVSGASTCSGCALAETVKTFLDANNSVANICRESPSCKLSNNRIEQEELNRGPPETSELTARSASDLLISPQTGVIPEVEIAGIAATEHKEELILTRSVGITLPFVVGSRYDILQDITSQTSAEGSIMQHSTVSNNPHQGANPKCVKERSNVLDRCRPIISTHCKASAQSNVSYGCVRDVRLSEIQTQPEKRPPCNASEEKAGATDAGNGRDLVSSSSSLSSSSSVDAISTATTWISPGTQEVGSRMVTANLWRTNQTHIQSCICFNLGTLNNSVKLGSNSSLEQKITGVSQSDATTDANKPLKPTPAKKEKPHYVDFVKKLNPVEINNEVLTLPIKKISSANRNVSLGRHMSTMLNQVHSTWEESSNLIVRDIFSSLESKGNNNSNDSGDNNAAHTAAGIFSVDNVSCGGDSNVRSKVSDKEEIRKIDKNIDKSSPPEVHYKVTSSQGSEVNRVKIRHDIKSLHHRTKFDMTPIYIDDDDDNTKSSSLTHTSLMPTTKSNARETSKTTVCTAYQATLADSTDAGKSKTHKCPQCNNNRGYQKSATDSNTPNPREAEPSTNTREHDVAVIYIDDDDELSVSLAKVSSSKIIDNAITGETLSHVQSGNSDCGNRIGLELNVYTLADTSSEVNVQMDVTESCDNIASEKRPRLGDKLILGETDEDADVAQSRADKDDALLPDMDNLDDAPSCPSLASDVNIAPSAASRCTAEPTHGMGVDNVRQLDNTSTMENAIDEGDETSESPDKSNPGEHPHMDDNAQCIDAQEENRNFFEAAANSSSSLLLSVNNINIVSTTKLSIALSGSDDKGSEMVREHTDADTTNVCSVQNKTNTTRATADVYQKDQALVGIIEDTQVAVSCNRAGHSRPKSDDFIHSTNVDDADASPPSLKTNIILTTTSVSTHENAGEHIANDAWQGVSFNTGEAYCKQNDLAGTTLRGGIVTHYQGQGKVGFIREVVRSDDDHNVIDQQEYYGIQLSGISTEVQTLHGKDKRLESSRVCDNSDVLPSSPSLSLSSHIDISSKSTINYKTMAQNTGDRRDGYLHQTGSTAKDKYINHAANKVQKTSTRAASCTGRDCVSTGIADSMTRSEHSIDCIQLRKTREEDMRYHGDKDIEEDVDDIWKNTSKTCLTVIDTTIDIDTAVDTGQGVLTNTSVAGIHNLRHVDTTSGLCTNARRHECAVISLHDAATTANAGGADSSAISPDGDVNVNSVVTVTGSAVCPHVHDQLLATSMRNVNDGSRSQQHRGVKRPATNDGCSVQCETLSYTITEADVALPNEAAFTVPSDAKRACIRHEQPPEREVGQVAEQDTRSLTQYDNDKAVSALKSAPRVDQRLCTSNSSPSCSSLSSKLGIPGEAILLQEVNQSHSFMSASVDERPCLTSSGVTTQPLTDDFEMDVEAKPSFDSQDSLLAESSLVSWSSASISPRGDTSGGSGRKCLVAESADRGVRVSQGGSLISAFIMGSTRDEISPSQEHDDLEPFVDSSPSEETRGSNKQNRTCIAEGDAGNVEARGSNDEALQGSGETSGSNEALQGSGETSGSNDEALRGNKTLGSNDETPGSNDDVLAGNDEAFGSNYEALRSNEVLGCNVEARVINDKALGGNNKTPGKKYEVRRGNYDALGSSNEAPGINEEVLGGNNETLGSNDKELGRNEEVLRDNYEALGNNQVQGSNDVVLGDH